MKLKSTFITHNTADGQLMISAGGDFNGMVRSNSTAAAIIDLLSSEITRDEIIAVMLDRYEVDIETLTSDVDKVLSVLTEIGALE